MPVIVIYLLTLLVIPLTGCKRRSDTFASGENPKTALSVENSYDVAAKAEISAPRSNVDVVAKKLEPTEVDQIHEESSVPAKVTISPEKKVVMEAMAKVDTQLANVEFQLQGALFEVRQSDSECLRQTQLLAATQKELNEALESHPERLRVQSELSASDERISAISGHIQSLVLEEKQPKSRKQIEHSLQQCSVCGWSGAENHLKHASLQLAKHRQTHREALQAWSGSRDEIIKSDPRLAELAKKCDDAQKKINERLSAHSSTSEFLGQQRALRDEKKRLQEEWMRLITQGALGRDAPAVSGFKGPSGS